MASRGHRFNLWVVCLEEYLERKGRHQEESTINVSIFSDQAYFVFVKLYSSLFTLYFITEAQLGDTHGRGSVGHDHSLDESIKKKKKKN